MCLWYSTDDEKDQTYSSEMHDGQLDVGEWFSTDLFSIIEGCITTVQGTYPISAFSSSVYRIRQRFNFNRFYSSTRDVVQLDPDQMN